MQYKYSLVTILLDDKVTPVVEMNGRWWLIAEFAPELFPGGTEQGWYEAISNMDAIAEVVEEINDTKPHMDISSDIKLLQPVVRPNKAIFMGFNYRDHLIKDAGITDFSKEDNDPFFFLKPASTALAASGEVIPFPEGSEKFDWETEMVAIVGRRGRNISIDNASSYIAGYSIGLDLSARDWQFNPRHPKQFDIFCGKVFDKSSPFGPSIVPASQINVDDLTIELRVNGELKQNSSTKEMIWKVPEQVAFLSRYITLEPGDLIFTGCPAGVGFATGSYLNVGDQLEAEISGLGRLSVTIGEPLPH